MFREIEYFNSNNTKTNYFYFDNYINYSSIFDTIIKSKKILTNYNNINDNLLNYIKENISTQGSSKFVDLKENIDNVLYLINNYKNNHDFDNLKNPNRYASLKYVNLNNYFYCNYNTSANDRVTGRQIFYNFKPYFLQNKTSEEVLYSLVVKKEYIEYVLFSYLNNELLDLDCLEFWVKSDLINKKYKYENLNIQKWINKFVIPTIKGSEINIVYKNNINKDLFKSAQFPNFKTIQERKLYIENLYENLKK